MNEIWRDIENYEGYYQISNDRKVRGLDRKDKNGRNLKGKIKTLHNSPYSFEIVRLCKDGEAKNHKVADLFKKAFPNLPYPKHNI
ncbi:NUMOD4 domain-containing protein [Bacillus toyonensis]|uniref:NUMOD4 domain-containing protein n=1 Tax=Bacillus toyonensis TaxID=155322 RepID=UPI003D64D271